jgi:hypothetical protein
MSVIAAKANVEGPLFDVAEEPFGEIRWSLRKWHSAGRSDQIKFVAD